MTPKISKINSRAMLISLSIGSWSARRYDKKVSRETNEAHGATSDAGRYNKNLLPGDAPSYKALTQHIGSMRKFIVDNSSPWDDTGYRVILNKKYQTIADKIRAGHHEFEKLLNAFWSDYPALKTRAEQLLNGMYNPDDYPDDILSRYSWAFRVKGLPTGSDFRVEDLPQAEVEAIQRDIEQRTKNAIHEAQKDAVRRLYEVLARIKERLTTAPVETGRKTKSGGAVFHDTLIENARELCEILKGLNLEDDAKLEAYRREVELMAAATEPETLRNDAKARVETANRADDILKAMTDTYGANLFKM